MTFGRFKHELAVAVIEAIQERIAEDAIAGRRPVYTVRSIERILTARFASVVLGHSTVTVDENNDFLRIARRQHRRTLKRSGTRPDDGQAASVRSSRGEQPGSTPGPDLSLKARR